MLTQEQCRERLERLMRQYPTIDHDRHLQDHSICQEYLQGNHMRFESLFETAYHKMRKYVIYHKSDLLSDYDKEDIIAEAAYTAVAQIHMFNGWSMYSTWMKAIAKYRILKCIKRKLQKEQELRSQKVLDNLPEVYSCIDMWENNDLIRGLMDRIPQINQLIVVYKTLHGMTYAEISRKMNLPVRSIQKKYYRSLKIMRKHL